MSDIRFNQWLHNSGTGGVSQVDGGHVGIGTTNPEIAVHSGNNKILNVGIVTASTYYGDGSNLTGITDNVVNINNNADNKIITGSGSANTLEAEATLTYTNNGSAAILNFKRSTTSGQETILYYDANYFDIETREATGMRLKTATADRLIINADGKIGVSRVATQHPFEIGHASSPTQSFWRGSTKGFAISAESAATYLMSYQDVPLSFSVSSGSSYTERLRITNDGKVVAGGNGAGYPSRLQSHGAGELLDLNSTSGAAIVRFYESGVGRFNIETLNGSSGLRFYDSLNAVERLRILSNGAMTCGHGANFNLHGSSTTGICLNGNGNSGQIIANADGNRALIIGRQSSYGQVIEFFVGSGGSNTNMAGITIPAANTLGLESNGTERLRINSTGVVQVMSERLTMGTSVTNGGANDGNFCIEFSSASRNAIKLRDTHNLGSTTYMVLVGGSATVGSITGTTGQAFYNNLSDYRSKQNDVKITDGIEKIKLLRPIRFNYKTDSSTLCDGFFAHEVTPAVPTAVTGEKDAVDSDGKIDPQMLDTGKIIPLLTAALQEAITKIETLETEVAALKGS